MLKYVRNFILGVGIVLAITMLFSNQIADIFEWIDDRLVEGGMV